MLTIDRQGTVEVFRPSGALNLSSLETVSEPISQSVSKGRPSILLDLSDVLLLDSAALEFLLGIDEQCAQRGGAFAISGCCELVCDVLRLTGIENRLQIFENATDGIRSFSQ